MSFLSVEGLHAGYGPVKVLHGIDFAVDEGRTAVILGANGAGKTTALRALSGMLANRGRILLDGEDITKTSTEGIVRKGVAHVPQGRGIFTHETVEENLRLGAYLRRDNDVQADMATFYELFPRLAERRRQPAGSLSGGEQQMLAISRALMLRPRLLLLDEPSLGLAPVIVQGVFAALATFKRDLGTTMLIVEQNAGVALDIADHAYVLESGTVAFAGTPDEIRADKSLEHSYLGY